MLLCAGSARHGALGEGAATWRVYVHAHQDDWQLFQSPLSAQDLAAGHHVLVVLTTAGDAGRAAPAPNPLYWQSREEASRESWRSELPTGLGERSGWLLVRRHRIAYWRAGRVIMLFMRLPNPDTPLVADCAPSAPSLCQLREGVLPVGLDAVDGSTRYATWADFVATLRAAIAGFAPDRPSTRVNAPDFDRDRQTSPPGALWCEAGCADHPDHLATADAVRAIAATSRWTHAWWIDYAMCRADPEFPDPRYPRTLPAPEHPGYRVKRRLFMAYHEKLRELTGFDEYGRLPRFLENCFQADHRR